MNDELDRLTMAKLKEVDQLAYHLACSLADGDTPDDEIIERFRAANAEASDLSRAFWARRRTA